MTTTGFAPPADVYEDEHNITLKIGVPDIDEKDIDVRIKNNTLTVHGERKFEKEEKEENFRHVERQYGSFTRSFTRPSSVDPGQGRWALRVGILVLLQSGAAGNCLLNASLRDRVRAPDSAEQIASRNSQNYPSQREGVRPALGAGLRLAASVLLQRLLG